MDNVMHPCSFSNHTLSLTMTVLVCVAQTYLIRPVNQKWQTATQTTSQSSGRLQRTTLGHLSLDTTSSANIWGPENGQSLTVIRCW